MKEKSLSIKDQLAKLVSEKPYPDNYEEALKIWDKFNKKHQFYIPGAQEETNKKSAPDEILKKYSSPEQQKSIVLIQQYWKKLRSQDSLMQVRSKNHPFQGFLGNEPVKKSINSQKLSQLENAINEGNWNDAIFQDETIPYLTLSLLTSKKISEQQGLTILERHQTFKDYPPKQTYRILDDNNQFTEDAKKILIDSMQTMNFLKPLSERQIESFRVLIMCLPKSEQIFYTTELGDIAISTSFGANLSEAFDTITVRKGEVIHMSNGAEHASGIARFGIDEYEVPKGEIGSKVIADIENRVRAGERPQALHYPGTIPYGDIHSYSNVSFFTASRHDAGHALGQSCTPNPFLRAFDRMIDVARAATDIKSSKEIWSWTDRDYNYFLSKNKTLRFDPTNLSETTALWCEMLSLGDADSRYSFNGYLFNNKTQCPPVLGTAIYIDMLKHPNQWLELKIAPESLTGEYKKSYELVKTIYDNIKNDRPSIQLLKCQLYFNLNLENRAAEFGRLNELINNNSEKISTLLEFKKVTKATTTKTHGTNSLNLTFNGVPTDLIRSNTYDFIKDTIEKGESKILGLVDPKVLPQLPIQSRYCLELIGKGNSQNILKKVKEELGLTSAHIQNAEDIDNLFTLTFKYNDISCLKPLIDSGKISISQLLKLKKESHEYLNQFNQEAITLITQDVMSLDQFLSMAKNERTTLCRLLQNERETSSERPLMGLLCEGYLSWSELIHMSADEIETAKESTVLATLGS
ncbi:hypothetical protein BN59_01565 [Legionella massiliensis]|uniref:Uncharacterized protein n=1 Tax=Legionella massiliensis TaxID=1034943 RepID=A0A078KZR5_9GAMM|nr:hypothetical protein [Legionella massiliensis]CDZ77283.1 hypothetical protein BN59_01565 [Legionella massiliensis]CEE13021.1 hypothetical protein BN1094_01565 [Legionella massiliensis]